ncbi:putative protein phosphatase 2C 10 [Hordeum vulgare]|nr:putative protein phosphatase 2C 10 [Hordeum vulgare]
MHERSSGPSLAAAMRLRSASLLLLLLSLSLLARRARWRWCREDDEGCSLMGFRGNDSPATGGGISEKGRFSYGFASCAGKRASMEDFYETRVDDVDGETVGLFGVFDARARRKWTDSFEIPTLETVPYSTQVKYKAKCEATKHTNKE